MSTSFFSCKSYAEYFVVFGSMPTFQDVQPIVANRAVLSSSVVVVILVKPAHSIPKHSILFILWKEKKKWYLVCVECYVELYGLNAKLMSWYKLQIAWLPWMTRHNWKIFSNLNSSICVFLETGRKYSKYESIGQVAISLIHTDGHTHRHRLWWFFFFGSIDSLRYEWTSCEFHFAFTGVSIVCDVNRASERAPRF